MHIEEYTTYQESEVLALYGSVGWTAYTEQPEALRRGFAGSLLTLAARENGTLVGLLRAVGDGCTVVLVQDLLVRPDHQRRGIGTALMQAALERFRSRLVDQDNFVGIMAYAGNKGGLKNAM